MEVPTNYNTVPERDRDGERELLLIQIAAYIIFSSNLLQPF